jgi:hypothetical protein
MWEALEQASLIKALDTTGWIYSAVSVTHYLGIFLCVGSVALVNLRVLGVAAKNRDVGELSKQLFPWAWIAFTLAMVSGFLMFATDATDWAPSRVFHIKLALIATSVVFSLIVQRGTPRWSEAPEIPGIAKMIALISLVLWIATILSASEIPALEGLG